MFAFWESVVEPLLQAARARVVVEIGSETGSTTDRLLEYAEREGGALHVIEPVPQFDRSAYGRRYGDAFVLYEQTSLEALPRLPDFDAVLVDGDHNWYTVFNELKLLEAHPVTARRGFPLTFVHDVGWPYGRRDLYYDPSTVPAEWRHPIETGGMLPGRRELVKNGVNPNESHAVLEGGPRNGVLTAVEDFLSGTSLDLRTVSVPGLYGLAVVAPASAGGEVASRMDDLSSATFLDRQCEAVEASRLAERAAVQGLEQQLRRARGAPSKKVTRRLEKLLRLLAALERDLDRIVAPSASGPRLLARVTAKRAPSDERLESARAQAARLRTELALMLAEDGGPGTPPAGIDGIAGSTESTPVVGTGG